MLLRGGLVVCVEERWSTWVVVCVGERWSSCLCWGEVV